MKRITIACVALLLAACREDAPPPEPPRPVASVVVAPSSVAGTRSYSGEVRARHETPLGFRVGGKLLRRLVDAGDAVKAGQPLAVLDAADAALEVARAEAERTRAAAELRRLRGLREKHFIDQSALDAATTAFRTADAATELARNVQQYTTLRADAAGVVAVTLAEPGQVLAAGEPVLLLALDGDREVRISLPETVLGTVRVGDAAEVRLWADETRALTARVREIAPAADPATRTYAARLALADAGAGVAIGMSARVVFQADVHGSVLIPAAAIIQQADSPAVWVIDARSVVTLRPVTVARWRDDGALVSAGLAAGERIVASGVHKVQAGETVRYVTASN